jgi:Icc-related predicted phosphoesterase
MKIAAFSDTHGLHKNVKVPDADVVIFAGDLMNAGYRIQEAADFAAFWNKLPHVYKILIAGNHDRLFEDEEIECLSLFRETIYLKDSGVTINGVNFWGSPYQPEFNNWAFNVQIGPEIKKHWDKIPRDMDILITHGPPFGIMDEVGELWGVAHVGCEELLTTVKVVRPKLHIFGHIHAGADQGGVLVGDNELAGTVFYNVSICNEQYKPVNKPHLIDFKLNPVRIT